MRGEEATASLGRSEVASPPRRPRHAGAGRPRPRPALQRVQSRSRTRSCLAGSAGRQGPALRWAGPGPCPPHAPQFLAPPFVEKERGRPSPRPSPVPAPPRNPGRDARQRLGRYPSHTLARPGAPAGTHAGARWGALLPSLSHTPPPHPTLRPSPPLQPRPTRSPPPRPARPPRRPTPSPPPPRPPWTPRPPRPPTCCSPCWPGARCGMRREGR